MSPARKAEAGTCSVFPGDATRFARASVLVLRKLSACAFPRASAIASAKFANSTVNQSHREIWTWKLMFPPPVNKSRIKKIVVIAAPASTTNITGFFSNVMGFSLAKDAAVAFRTISGSNSGRDRTSFLGRSDVGSSGGICGFTFGSVVIVGMVVT